MVLFTLLCGHLPFEDSNTQSLYQKILNAKYKFTCFLSKEAKSLIENILVPDPNLLYGLKQITSNTWFKTKYKATVPLPVGTRIGIDELPLNSNVLHQMKQDKLNKIDIGYVKKCI